MATVVLLTDDTRRDLARLNGNRLVNHAFLLFVVTHFHIAGNREVFAERMSDKAVIGQDAAQVWMIVEHDAIHIEASRSYQSALL